MVVLGAARLAATARRTAIAPTLVLGTHRWPAGRARREAIGSALLFMVTITYLALRS